jgi:glycosylphosphatidylinositol transamidase (GPIT) subunit GPI8
MQFKNYNNNASRAFFHQCENLKRKRYNCIADVCFAQRCLHKSVSPNVAEIKVPSTYLISKFTQHKASATRLKDEVKKVVLDYILLPYLLLFVLSWKSLYLLGLVSDLHFHSILEHKIGFPLY